MRRVHQITMPGGIQNRDFVFIVTPEGLIPTTADGWFIEIDRAPADPALSRSLKETAMTTNSLEASDQAVAAVSTAPRVTLADLKASIREWYHVNGLEAVNHAVPAGNPAPHPLSVLSLCILVLHNGWTVVGKSAPASVQNFNPEIGKDLAFKDALTQIWPLMGFELRCRLHQLEQSPLGETVASAGHQIDPKAAAEPG